MKVVALQTWSNGTITMEEKSVQDIPDALAEQLIADGICADAAEYFGGGGGESQVEYVITYSENGNIKCDHTYEELETAKNAGKTLVWIDNVIVSGEVPLTIMGYFGGAGPTPAQFYASYMVANYTNGKLTLYRVEITENDVTRTWKSLPE